VNELLVIALILNAISVAATHCVVAENHTHWVYRRWQWWERLMPKRLHQIGDWFHAFSGLRLPLLCVVVYQMPHLYWIAVPVALQAVWWLTKKSFRKEWKSIKNPF